MSNADGERGKQLSFESELVKANEDAFDAMIVFTRTIKIPQRLGCLFLTKRTEISEEEGNDSNSSNRN
jgi:hypothetical protein